MVFTGAVLGSVGFIISSFITKIEYLYLTLGIMPGLAFACSYAPTVSHVAKYFTARRSLATGSGMAGSGIGAFVAAPLTTYLLEEYSLSGTLLILGGFIFNLAVAAMLLRPVSFYERKLKRDKQGKLPQVNQNNKETSVDRKADAKAKANGNLAPIANENGQLKTVTDLSENNTENKIEKKRHVIVTIICNRGFIILASIMFLLSVGYYNIATIVLPAWGDEQELEAAEIGLVLSIFGGCDAFGRVLFSAFNDKQYISTASLLSGSMLCTGGLTFLLIYVGNNFLSLAIICAFNGFFIGCMPPLQAILVVQIIGLENLQTAFGILFMLGLPQIFIQQGFGKIMIRKSLLTSMYVGHFTAVYQYSPCSIV